MSFALPSWQRQLSVSPTQQVASTSRPAKAAAAKAAPAIAPETAIAPASANATRSAVCRRTQIACSRVRRGLARTTIAPLPRASGHDRLFRCPRPVENMQPGAGDHGRCHRFLKIIEDEPAEGGAGRSAPRCQVRARPGPGTFRTPPPAKAPEPSPAWPARRCRARSASRGSSARCCARRGGGRWNLREQSRSSRATDE